MTNSKDFRFGSWRDWSHPLNSNMDKDAYEAAEYWLSRDPTLGNLPKLYSNLGSYDIDESDYIGIDLAQKDSGSLSLRESYLDLIKSRANDQGYEHCAAETLFCTDERCSTVISDFVSMSAHCIIYDVEFIDACEGEPAEITVALEPDSSHSFVKLMVDGVIHDSDTPVPFTSGERIWAINTNFSALIVPNAEIVFRNESPPCDNPYLSMVSQRINSGANAQASSSTSNMLSPGRWLSAQTYDSYEDLSQDSVISTVEGSDFTWTDVTVQPLGEAEWESAHSASAFGQNSEDQPVSTATATSFSSTVTVSDDTSMTTTGIHTATATRTEDARHATGSNTSTYPFATIDVPAELTVTWGCDMSNVSVSSITPGGFESLLSITNTLYTGQNNWECEPRNWTIGADATVTIKMYTSYQSYNDDNSAAYLNGGGAYEIKLQAIIPD